MTDTCILGSIVPDMYTFAYWVKLYHVNMYQPGLVKM